MEQLVFIFLGALAAITTGVMWTTIIDPRLLLAPALMWVVWGFGATDVTQTTNCCVQTQSYQSLAILGWLIAGIIVVFWIGAILGKVELD